MMIHLVKVGDLYVSYIDGETLGVPDSEVILTLSDVRLTDIVSEAKIFISYDVASGIAKRINGEVMVFDEVL